MAGVFDLGTAWMVQRLSSDEERKKEINKSLVDDLIGVSDGASDAVLSDSVDLARGAFFRSFLDLKSGLLRMQQAEYLFRRYPWHGTRISKSDHLYFVACAYLQEVYIVRCRLDQTLKLMNRCGKRHFSTQSIESEIHAIIRKYDKVMEPLSSLRGLHVHRSDFSDRNLSRVRMLELFEDAEWLPERNNLYTDSVREVRKVWMKRVKRDKVVLDAFMESVFERYSSIWSVIFSDKHLASV